MQKAPISSRKSQRARRLEELLALLEVGDTLLVTELSRLGRSTGEAINLVNGLVASGVRVIVISMLTIPLQTCDFTEGSMPGQLAFRGARPFR